jgi:hypothetical protein
MAVRFTEVSFSVLLAGVKDSPEEGGAFLVQAFNSFRPFAFSSDYFSPRLISTRSVACRLWHRFLSRSFNVAKPFSGRDVAKR